MNATAGIRRALAGAILESVLRVRQRWRTAASRAARLTGAAVASYVAAEALLPGDEPVLAALTALLVVEVTLVAIVTSGVHQRHQRRRRSTACRRFRIDGQHQLVDPRPANRFVHRDRPASAVGTAPS